MATKTKYPGIAAKILAVCLAFSVPQCLLAETKEAKHKSRQRGHIKNLPAIEPVPLESLTVDQEFNLYAGSGFSNTTVDYGLTNRWNVGVSFLSAQFYSAGRGAQPFQPEALFNLEAHFGPAPHSILVVGTQTGAGITPQGSALMDYSYVDYQWHWPRWNSDLDFGGYYANAALAGSQSIGWHVNLEWPLWSGLRMSGDYVSGRSGVSGATLKLLYPISEALKLGFGVQLPAPSSGNDFSGLLGVYWH